MARLIGAGERIPEASLRPVHPDGYRVARAAEHLSGLGMRELIPEHQGERFSLGWPEAGDRRGEPVPPGAVPYRAVHGAVRYGAVDEELAEALGGFLVVRAGIPVGGVAGLEPGSQLATAPGAAEFPGGNAPGHPGEPQPVSRGLGNPGEPAPRDGEDLGDHIGHVISRLHPADRICLDAPVVLLVQQAETALSLVTIVLDVRHQCSSRMAIASASTWPAPPGTFRSPPWITENPHAGTVRILRHEGAPAGQRVSAGGSACRGAAGAFHGLADHRAQGVHILLRRRVTERKPEGAAGPRVGRS